MISKPTYYCFQSQTGHLMDNDPVMSKIFASTLRGPVFTWFMRLPPETIKVWTDVEREFLGHFFDDDAKISVNSLLTTKQKEDKTVESFVECFREMLVQCSYDMS